jgi:hypothetical protein
MALSPAEFEQRLESISIDEAGKHYGRVHIIHDAQADYGTAVTKYSGYLALSDAFKSFFLETVELINTQCRPKVTKPLSEHYGLFVPQLAHAFQSLCGAEHTANYGYPYQAYTVLRNTFDNVIIASAILQKITDYHAVMGVVSGQPFDPIAMKRLRKKAEIEVRKQMTGDQSGLSPKTLGELGIWDALFDFEVHGGRLTLAASMGWLQGREPMPIVPKFEEKHFTMFLNRYCEIAWMLHRLIPAMQPPEIPLPAEWAEKWRILDESFEATSDALTEQVGKAIGAAIVELVKTKFPFNANSVFPL